MVLREGYTCVLYNKCFYVLRYLVGDSDSRTQELLAIDVKQILQKAKRFGTKKVEDIFADWFSIWLITQKYSMLAHKKSSHKCLYNKSLVLEERVDWSTVLIYIVY